MARDIALADATMSVNESSPREVKDFYGAVFKPIDDIMPLTPHTTVWSISSPTSRTRR